MGYKTFLIFPSSWALAQEITVMLAPHTSHLVKLPLPNICTSSVLLVNPVFLPKAHRHYLFIIRLPFDKPHSVRLYSGSKLGKTNQLVLADLKCNWDCSVVLCQGTDLIYARFPLFIPPGNVLIFFPDCSHFPLFSSTSGNLACKHLFQAKPFHYYQYKRSASSQSANLLRTTAFWGLVKYLLFTELTGQSYLRMFSYLMPFLNQLQEERSNFYQLYLKLLIQNVNALHVTEIFKHGVFLNDLQKIQNLK